MKQPKLNLRTIFKQALAIIRRASQPDFIAAVVVAVTVIGVTVNTSSVIMQNYQLEREVRVMQQKVSVAQIELDTQRLKNQYYSTDYYLDIAARKQLSKGLPGEKLIIVPKSIALTQLPQGYKEEEQPTASDQSNLSNLRKWQLFLSGDLN